MQGICPVTQFYKFLGWWWHTKATPFFLSNFLNPLFIQDENRDVCGGGVGGYHINSDVGDLIFLGM